MICLGAGSFTYAVSTISKSAMTTVRAAPGLERSDVTIPGGVDLQASNNLAFVGMTIGGANVGSESETATNIRFVDIQWSDGVCVNLPGTKTGSAITFDRSDFPTVRHPGCGGEGRLQFNGRNTPHARGYDQGVTVSHNRFHGPTSGTTCTDMIQITGGASGVDISHNEFESLRESACGRIHGDPIQFFGAAYTTIDGNLIRDSSTGLMNGDCNGSPARITNNVFVSGGEISANTLRVTGSGGDVIDHNTIVGAAITIGTPNCVTVARDETITNNVAADVETVNGATYTGRVDNNLFENPAARGTRAITGSPVFAGGPKPTTWPDTGWRATRPDITLRVTGAASGSCPDARRSADARSMVARSRPAAAGRQHAALEAVDDQGADGLARLERVATRLARGLLGPAPGAVLDRGTR